MNKVRIIGGNLRSRTISFPDAEGLRPTPDRVRETLFNWLGQTLYGRTCLDLFAGSGALGFEAASRGAERIVMVEKSRAALLSLQDNVKKLGCVNVFVQEQDGLEFASRDVHKYDVIFLDPPFQSDYLSKLLEILPQRLNDNGVVYVESGTSITVPPPWQVMKSGKAGQVHYQLLQVSQIQFAGWQAGHGDAKHLGRVGLLLRAPALGGLCPTVSHGHRKEPRSEWRGISRWIDEE